MLLLNLYKQSFEKTIDFMKGLNEMNDKKPLIMRIIVLALVAAMVLGLVISTAMGAF